MKTIDLPASWQGGRIDGMESADLRWHQLLNRRTPSATPSFLGFCCDEGVRRNKGRTGAADGPDAIRKQLTNLPAHGLTALIDQGNICCEGGRLEEAQARLGEKVCHILQEGNLPILLGGGHEIAWGHYQGIRDYQHARKEAGKLGVLNIDAHFDLRTPEDGFTPNSGTSFWHMLRDCESQRKGFNYMVVGIQPVGNTPALYETAAQAGTRFIEAAEIDNPIRMAALEQWIDEMDHIYLTICLDAFAMDIAPGVSAPSANGLHCGAWLPRLFGKIRQKLISADIAELNPSLDTDNRTARLAAYLLFVLLTGKY